MVRTAIVVMLAFAGWFLTGCAESVARSDAPLASSEAGKIETPKESAALVQIDPALEAPAMAALAEWSSATGRVFRTVLVATADQAPGVGYRFEVGPESPELGRTYPETSEIRIDVEFAKQLWWIDADALRKACLHELGHAFWLQFEGFEEPGGYVDTWHYRGPEPSVMFPDETKAAEHLTKVDLDAYWMARERELPR